MSISISGLGNVQAQAVSGASARSSGIMSKGLTRLFQKLDTGGTGSLTKTQFEAAFKKLKLPASIKGMGADALFNKLDPNGTGSISQDQFVTGMKQVFTGLQGQGYSGLSQAAMINPATTLSAGQDALLTALNNQPSTLTNSNLGTNYTGIA